MKFNKFGDKNSPVIIMLAGSFCPAESMENIYSRLKSDFYIIAPTYNGCYEGSKDFTSRRGEAEEVCGYLKKESISEVALIYGQSMGSEVGLEVLFRLTLSGIAVGHCFFDGAPCANMPKPMRRVMLGVFRSLMKTFKNKSVDDALNSGIIKMMSGGNPENLRPMVESIVKVAPYMNDNSVKNQVECCYTFDYPEFAPEIEKNITFFYGSKEKAYKLSYKGVRKSYPNAVYIIQNGEGHCTYCSRCTDGYIKIILDKMT